MKDIIMVRLAYNGQVVACPETVVGPSELAPTDTLHRTHGFTSYTVVACDGTVRGWAPKEAGDRHPTQVR